MRATAGLFGERDGTTLGDVRKYPWVGRCVPQPAACDLCRTGCCEHKRVLDPAQAGQPPTLRIAADAHSKTPEAIAEYLNAAIKEFDGDPRLLMRAFRNVLLDEPVYRRVTHE